MLTESSSRIVNPQKAMDGSPPGWTPNAIEQKRGLRIHPRMDEMLKYRFPYEIAWRRAMLNYEGISRDIPDTPRDEETVAPYAFIFVESKTSEEMASTQDYVFTPIEDASDTWKADLMNDTKKHADRIRKMPMVLHRAFRHKNLFGVGIIRTGYRCIMREISERIMDEEDPIGTKWDKKVVPMYDDVFCDVVSPFNFAVDPNAITMDDAEDCLHMHVENWNVFQEIYCNDPRYKNTDGVKPGVFYKFQTSAAIYRKDIKDQVLIIEYFNKIRDEWVIYANGVEILANPLPDDHKELPFISLHNNASFLSPYINSYFSVSPTSGQSVALPPNIYTEETFWSKGDPELLRDLIDLRTGFARAAFRAAKLAGETIVATMGNFRFMEKKWRSGDQAVGAMGKFQVVPLGQNNVQNFQFMFDVIDNIMILAAGVDPRNLSSSVNTRTATEAAIQRETALKRLQQNLIFNQENGMVRLGRLDLSNFEQYYSIPKLERITGNTNIKKFDELVKDPDTGKVLYGKKLRRIRSSVAYTETKEKGKYVMRRDETGVKSFLARPEYIRTAELDVSVDSSHTIGQIRALEIEQSFKALQVFTELVPLMQSGMIKPEDLPNIHYISEKIIENLGWSKQRAMGVGGQNDQNKSLPPKMMYTPPSMPSAPQLGSAVQAQQMAAQQGQQQPNPSSPINASQAP